MNNASINTEAIVTIANALGEINNRVVYVGGAVVSLYINDPAAEDVRPTKDIDIAVHILTERDLELLRKELTAKGFTQTADDAVICRFRYKNILVDVMSTHAVGWASANPWFAPGFHKAEHVYAGRTRVSILPLPYFLATKFSAYHERGGNDPRTSHDVEDIIYILDNRTDIVEQIQQSPSDVQEFLKEEFTLMTQSDIFREAIRAHLAHETQTERFLMITEKLKRISGSV